ncbi:MAG: hypothetical protein MPJ08_08265, partial [Nitrosopumilus sp.]|nr:hypothetical protein [Nitrosopumilus sp.]
MEERRGTRPSPSCGRERELVRGMMLALAAGLLAAGAAEVYGASFTPVPSGAIYVNSDESFKRLASCENGAGTVTLDPSIATLDDGVHTIRATCDNDDGSPSTVPVSITVDKTPPRTNVAGVPTYVGAPLGSAYSHPDIPCLTDGGSPVERVARSAYADPANNTIPGITATTPAGTYNYWFRCYDAAGNTHQPSRVRILVEPPIPSSNLGASASDSLLTGTANFGHVFLPTEYKDEHGLECRPGGDGTPVDNSKLVFVPWLPSLGEAARHEVRIYCLDSQNRATMESSKTATVIVDVHSPIISGPPRYITPPRHPWDPSTSSGIISPAYGQNARPETTEQVVARLSCLDSFDGTPANAMRLPLVHEVTKSTFDYEPLGDRITPHFLADHTPDDGPPIFDVLNATCTDRAGHSITWLWILAPDRAYHPDEDQDVVITPVITINDFVTEHPPGPYEPRDGSIECADYLAHELASNSLTTSLIRAPVTAVEIGDVRVTPVTGMQPGVHRIPHACVDGALAYTHTYTYAFVPSDNGPVLTIDDSATSVPAGGAVPVTATCRGADGTPGTLETEIFSVHHSTEHDGVFSQDPEDPSIDRKYHAVFTCRDSLGRLAVDSAVFTQTAVGPRITLDNYDLVGAGKESRMSALDNAHIHGTPFQDPGATCINTATDETVTHDVSGAPDENTALGKWSVVKYSCEIGGTTHEVSRHVRTLASRLVVDMPGTTTHDGRPVFVDDAACTNTLGRPIEAVVQRITGPDGSVVESLDHMTPAGTYTIDYLCTDTTVFRGAGSPSHLRDSVIPHEFSKQVSVSGPSTAPFISLVGDGQRPVIPGQIYEMAVIPGDKYEELGFACTDRPGLEDVTTVEANFTDGSVIPDDGATIEYTCTAPDGDAAEPQYRRLVPEPGLHVRIDEKKYVVGRASVSDPAPAADTLPTATCYRGTEKVGDDLVITLGSDGRSDNKHRRNLNDDIKISPRWNPDRALSFESWNRTHVMTFRCAGDGTEQPATRSTTFHQVPARALMEFPGRTFEDGTETRGSLLRNLHIQGAEFRDGNVTCGYFDDGRFPAVKLSDDPTIITRTGEVTSSTPVSTTEIPVTYTCSPPDVAPASLTARVYVAERPLPVLSGLDGAPAGPHENSAPFASPVGCDGMFGGLLADDEDLGHVALNHTATATGPGGEYELNDDLGIDAGAPPGQYVINHECTQTFFNREFSAEPASITVMVEAAPPPAPKPVLTLTSTEVHLMPGDTHEPPLECTAGGSTINNLILSNDT